MAKVPMNRIVSELDSAPTHAHVIAMARRALAAAGYADVTGAFGAVAPPAKYFFVTESGALAAFDVRDYRSGVVFAAKGDSPGFCVRRDSRAVRSNCEQVDLLPYGDALYFAWLDRDLTLAGEVLVRRGGRVEAELVHIAKAVMEIPSIASHLSKNSIKTDFRVDRHFRPVLSVCAGDECGEQTLLRLMAEECGCECEDIVDYELFAVSAENAACVGINSEFLNSQRIDGSLGPLLGLNNFISSSNTNSGFRAFCIFKQYGVNASKTQDSDFLSSVFKRVNITDTTNVSVVLLENLPSTAPNHTNEFNNIPLGSGIYFVSPQDSSLKINTNHLYQKAKNILQQKNTKNTKVKTNSSKEKDNFTNINVNEVFVPSNCYSPLTMFPDILPQIGDILQIGFPVIGRHSIRETCFIPDIEEYNAALNLLFGFL